MAKRESAKKEHKDCGCIFCTSKCPACGSTNVYVQINAEWDYTNDTKDVICMNKGWQRVLLECQECGAEYSTDEGTELDKLMDALEQMFPGNSLAEWREDGKVEVNEYTWEMVEEGQEA